VLRYLVKAGAILMLAFLTETGDPGEHLRLFTLWEIAPRHMFIIVPAVASVVKRRSSASDA
jgi:hypothetical protein